MRYGNGIMPVLLQQGKADGISQHSNCHFVVECRQFCGISQHAKRAVGLSESCAAARCTYNLVRSLNEAVAYSLEHGGKLVDKAGLRSAIDRYRNVAKDAGLTGKVAPHSLRYAYSQEAKVWHMKNGLSRKEAEAMVSMDLGHGDGRAHYVFNVYLK